MNNEKSPIEGITRRNFLAGAAAAAVVLRAGPWAMARMEADKVELDAMAGAFSVPPFASGPWVYWWWLDGDASKEGITRDLVEMKRQGICGVLLFDAGTGGPLGRQGPAFMSAEWRENFRHAVQEAGRLGIEMGVSLCSGWDAGGPWVEREDAIKTVVWSETTIEGPKAFDGTLQRPELQETETFLGRLKPAEKQDWYRDIAVLACRVGADAGTWNVAEAIDLTSATQDGHLAWQAPEGKWTILRFGFVLAEMRTTNASGSRTDWEIDPLSSQALDRHFAATAAKLIQDAGPLAGTTFRYTHIDSWEIGQVTWTAKFIEEFRVRRGYDPVPYLPALAKKTVNGPEITERFLWDYRRTLADLVAENYYGRLSKLSREHGLGTHSESGGPFYNHNIDGLECDGIDDIPMGEFWATLQLPNYITDESVAAPFFKSTSLLMPTCNTGSVRQAATAARLYGRPFCQAESFTGFNDDWTEDPSFLKPYADHAFCLGLGRLVIHNFMQSARVDIKPGNAWEHVSMHFNPNITWWDKSQAWLTYLTRCQHLLRQGKFAADILYFSGEAIPNFVLIDHKPLPGYDFDTINAQALLTRATAHHRSLTLRDGTSYRYLVFPEKAAEKMTPAVLAKIHQLVEDGITLVGSRPKEAPGLTDYPRSDEQVRGIANILWGTDTGVAGIRKVGKGRVIWGKPLQEILAIDDLPPDLEVRSLPRDVQFDWIHRFSADGDIYFLANGGDQELEVEVAFRVSQKAPELWDAVTGKIRGLSEFRSEGRRTVVPLRFDPRQSFFIIFRSASDGRQQPGKGLGNFPRLSLVAALDGSWEVGFDPKWGGPERVVFESLVDWTQRPEDGIRHYSGTATYRKTFDLPPRTRGPLFLDLGRVKNVAQVFLNGKDLGVVWTAPWRVEITDSVKAQGNLLEIEVVNLWPNRLIGDSKLPRAQRRTVTNVRTYESVLPSDLYVFSCPVCEARRKSGQEAHLLPSGLHGPVTLRSVVGGF